MIPVGRLLALFSSVVFLATFAWAQTPTPSEDAGSSELLNLARKIDQQNIKIDLLSQQILRLQQEIEHPKSAATENAPRATQVNPTVPPNNGNTHIVAKGETLTSIARQHKVTVEELQKLNHIADDRRLQIGQTLVLPGAPGAPASPSPSATEPNE
jgi:LysM repeat protein